ncbi:MAG: zinc ribbon domain-containing protein [Eubacteriales bacterium]|nr:zinc ribbon domain-containing protein [Eubacteriales bacterium]
MICKYCGSEIEDNATVCPYCGSEMGDPEGAFEPIYINREQQNIYNESVSSGQYEDGAEDFEDDEDEEGFAPRKKRLSLPSLGKRAPGAAQGGAKELPNLSLNTIISIACALFSFLCLVMICNVNGNMKDRFNTLNASITQVQMSYNTIEDKLSTLDTTVANVQQEAYSQLASTNITITKDLTSLTGPVTLGKYNMMFIIKAKGNLDLSKSFMWQKYNPTSGGWEEIVFTGNATSNEQYGLRLENLMEDGEYKSVLWANGITKDAEGTYRCQITDLTGIKKTSYEATVTVGDAAA